MVLLGPSLSSLKTYVDPPVIYQIGDEGVLVPEIKRWLVEFLFMRLKFRLAVPMTVTSWSPARH